MTTKFNTGVQTASYLRNTKYGETQCDCIRCGKPIVDKRCKMKLCSESSCVKIVTKIASWVGENGKIMNAHVCDFHARKLLDMGARLEIPRDRSN